MERIVTVIICTYNRAGQLKVALQSLAEQRLDKKFFEVLVIDNNSVDNTKEISLSFSNVLNLKYFIEKEQGLSHARNRGILESQSEYIAYLDDDAKADTNWLESAVSIINLIRPEIFGGPYFAFYNNPKPAWFKDAYGSNSIDKEPRYLHRNEYLCGSNIFFKKDIFKRINNFDVTIGMKANSLSMGEESKVQEEAKIKKIKIYYDPNIVIYHLVPPSKMNLEYIVKRNIISSKIAYNFLCKSSLKSSFRNLYFSLKNTLAIIILLILYPVRNRKKYPYWQNYFIERFLHRTRSFIWFYYDARKILSNNDSHGGN